MSALSPCLVPTSACPPETVAVQPVQHAGSSGPLFLPRVSCVGSTPHQCPLTAHFHNRISLNFHLQRHSASFTFRSHYFASISFRLPYIFDITPLSELHNVFKGGHGLPVDALRRRRAPVARELYSATRAISEWLVMSSTSSCSARTVAARRS